MPDSVWKTIVVQYNLLSTFAIDAGVALYNALTPSLPNGTAIPSGKPGHAGRWPEFRAPEPSDSRSPCPALNAMANHGILPRDGKNIRFTELSARLHETYNFANTFCFFVPYYFANLIDRDYHTGTLDLADVARHNAIEHDASLCRGDIALQPDGQAHPNHPLIERLLASASGSGGRLTAHDLAAQMSLRMGESRAANSSFSTSMIHRGFGCANSATMITVFGGEIPLLRTWLLEERLPDGWEPRNRDRLGTSMAAFNRVILGIYTKIDERKAMEESRKGI